MKRLIFLFLFALFIFPLISANAYAVEKSVNLVIPANTTTCNITLVYPNSSIALNNKAMSLGTGYFNYTIASDYLNTQGTYSYFTNCSQYGTFEITYTGKELSTSQGVLYGSLIILLVLFVIAMLILRSSLPSENPRSDGGQIISISQLKYLRTPLLVFSYFMVAFICYIASNLSFAFLSEVLVAKVFFFLFRIMILASPIMVIVWFVGIFFSVFEDKEVKKVMLMQGINSENRGFRR